MPGGIGTDGLRLRFAPDRRAGSPGKRIGAEGCRGPRRQDRTHSRTRLCRDGKSPDRHHGQASAAGRHRRALPRSRPVLPRARHRPHGNAGSRSGRRHHDLRNADQQAMLQQRRGPQLPPPAFCRRGSRRFRALWRARRIRFGWHPRHGGGRRRGVQDLHDRAAVQPRRRVRRPLSSRGDAAVRDAASGGRDRSPPRRSRRERAPHGEVHGPRPGLRSAAMRTHISRRARRSSRRSRSRRSSPWRGRPARGSISHT